MREVKEYLHLFKTQEEFNEARKDENYYEPWVSVTKQTSNNDDVKSFIGEYEEGETVNRVDYNKNKDEGGDETLVEMPLTFEFLNDSDVNWISIQESGDTKFYYNIQNDVNKFGWYDYATNEFVYTTNRNPNIGNIVTNDNNGTGQITNRGYDGYLYFKSNLDSITAIEYKKNNGEWTVLPLVATESPENGIYVTPGDAIAFRGDNLKYGDDYSGNSNFFCGLKHKLKGNIMSLINSTNFSGLTTLENSFTFRYLFDYSIGLKDASQLILPATTLANGCYYGMFRGCTNLTTAPQLPATTLAQNCYAYMFEECMNLTTAPLLPATTLVDSCYAYMFSYCTSLITAPELPATTLTWGCYSGMFSGCTNLNYIKCLATDISAFNCTSNWVSGVAASGTFVKAASMTGWTTGADGIPEGWGVQNDGDSQE